MFNDFRITVSPIPPEQFYAILLENVEAYGESDAIPTFNVDDEGNVDSYQPLEWGTYLQDLIAISIKIPDITIDVENYETGVVTRIHNGQHVSMDTSVLTQRRVGAYAHGMFVIQHNNNQTVVSAKSQQHASGWAHAEYGLAATITVQPATHADVLLAETSQSSIREASYNG